MSTDFTPAEGISSAGQPVDGETTVNLRIDYPERLSRWLLFVKWLFVIPAVIVLFLYGIAVFITTFISFWAILFTGRYPSGLFDFARGFMALQARTYAYFPLLLTDQYPLASRLETEEAVRYEVEEPQRLSRGLLLLKLLSFLLSVVGTLTGIVAFVLIIAAIPAWFAILITGRYPQGMFDFMVAVAQWIARVTAWEYLLRDEWSLFATTQGVGVLVGVGAVAAAGLTIVTNVMTFWPVGGEEEGPGSTAIQVEDTRYRLDYFASRLKMYVDLNGGPGVVQPSGALPAVCDLLIQEEIVRRSAAEMDVTATEDEIREEIASRLGITADDESFDVVFQQELARSELSEMDYRQMVEAAVVTDKLREKFLAEVPESAESVHYRQILVSEQATAEEIREQIEAGRDFAALATESSLDPATKDEGGDVGWVPRGVLGAATEELVFPMEVGAIIVIPSPAGVLVIEVLEKDGDHSVEEEQKEPLAARLFAEWAEEKKQLLSIVNNMDIHGNFDEGMVEWAVDRAYRN